MHYEILSQLCCMLYKFNTLSIPALHNCQLLKLVHKFTHRYDKLPSVFSNYFTENYIFCYYNTRTKDCLHVDLFASSMGQRSIKYKGCTPWNSLSDEIKSTSTSLFDDKLKKCLTVTVSIVTVVC